MSSKDAVILNDLYEFNCSDTLGKGSFGTVYKGRVIATNEVVAIKALNRSLLQIQNQKFMIDQLKKEINLMQEIKSEHIVRIYDLVGTETHIYIIIEYCGDGDLRGLLEKNNYNISESQAISILQQILQGFKSLIDQGYVHRDIKPENILINKNTFKIADFGFATKIQDQNAQVLKECVGSPLYMSPQLLQQKPYSSKSDIWSIGLLYYEILFGKLPWLCRDINSLLIQIRKVPVRFPFDKPVTDFSKDFIKGCLQFEEYKRFSWDQVFNHELFQLDDELSPIPRSQSQKQFSGDLSKVNSKQNLNDSNERSQTPKLEQKKKDSDEDDQKQRENAQPKQQQSPFQLSRDASPIKQLQETRKDLKQNTESNFMNKKHFKTEISLDFKKEEIDEDENSKKSENSYLNSPRKNKTKEIKQNKNHAYEEKQNLKEKSQNDENAKSLPKSQILNQSLVAQQNKLKDLNKTDKKILMMLQDIVMFYNINLKDLFDRFDLDQDGKLTGDEFFILLKKLDKQIKESQAKHLFSILDKQENGYMLFDQFESMFNEWDFSNLQDRAQVIINELKEIVKVNKLDLENIFKNFDKGQNGNLSLQEFEELILLIAPGIKKNEIKQIFDKFDLNKDQQISFNEFSNVMTRKIFLQDDEANVQTKQIANIVKELKSVLLSKNISTELVFKNFTKKNHPYMKLSQLKKLARIVDDSIDDQGIHLLFRYMDIDNDGEISYTEFKTSLDM
ncbi:kinase domain protein (macronuclear) [Tetrahymena thermophila SB210]|uniref:Kinase domain protein n=1 Tax=Tetrahymena thermophila (strain SB210) TaxID=312017 RepID=I7MKK8_TETTS|nr:kinase domain protein [Tetrahymena thermophila SB210]EAR99474.2 kinase domain protein [Tetrahymena thermophila SB210]|eukprot:XP_001019719.2 kinase domain protein [Tetrahymena thermophila SB210]